MAISLNTIGCGFYVLVSLFVGTDICEATHHQAGLREYVPWRVPRGGTVVAFGRVGFAPHKRAGGLVFAGLSIHPVTVGTPWSPQL